MNIDSIYKEDHSEQKQVLVSVVCTAFNHESYIKEALDGFLMQKTNFPIEVIITDDKSTDGTAKILIEYEKKHLNLFKIFYHKENLHSKGVDFFQNEILPNCSGKYIAFCEGDDYWIDNNKLQKQVDFLNNNPEYGMVYTKAKVYHESKNEFQKKSVGKYFHSVEDLLLGNHIPTPTVLFKKELYYTYLNEIQPASQKWLMGDYPLWLWISWVSKIKFMDYTSSVYRVTDNSASHSVNYLREKLFVESYYEIKLFFANRFGYNHLESKIAEKIMISKAYIYLKKGESNISELLVELNELGNRTFKLIILKFVLNYSFFRMMLKIYWRSD